ncbi:MAG: glyoxalase superfamily protein [Amphiplicatus sp.]
MRPDIPLPGLDALKRQARRLRDGLEADGDFITHSESLELIAKQYGYRDWNTLHAACGNRPAPAPLALGARVTGRYLGQPFAARVIGVEAQGHGRMRLSLDLDEPVDVVTFESFSAFRRRITGVVNEDGKTSEKTSNGAPHLVVER